MANQNRFTKILAISGTSLVWLVMLAPVVFSLIRIIREAPFRLDYLLPAEVLPLVLVGAGLIIWAGIRAKSRVKQTAWALGIGLALLAAGLVTAQVTGMAEGTIGSEGFVYNLVLSTIIAYDLAVVGIGISGILLTRDLYRLERTV